MEKTLKKKALELREKGLSYSQIKEIVKVSKSTLSIWLRDMPLSRARVDELRNKNLQRIEKFQTTMRLKAQARLQGLSLQIKQNILPISNREIFLLGLFLYWGEGKKGYSEALSISNTDPRIIVFSITWMTSCLGVDRKKIRVSLHLYSDMDEEKELSYWSNLVNLPRNQFYKPYIKKTKLSDRKHKGFSHGTCNISVCDVRLKERILVSIETIVQSTLDKRV